ncbi:uncharacterized protein LOC121929580 isoform X2 [Sceloporus undulatus]|uniref:uncharacterized protein LOC121929580 isoform X2 n=1 Tax=Sceloporus undulatus TaxID=8520 RepID=UPI001C4C45B1|nr:uncharacterized protein LOC121929580 isoform X2 [Sceloporus undulatus]
MGRGMNGLHGACAPQPVGEGTGIAPGPANLLSLVATLVRDLRSKPSSAILHFAQWMATGTNGRVGAPVPPAAPTAPSSGRESAMDHRTVEPNAKDIGWRPETASLDNAQWMESGRYGVPGGVVQPPAEVGLRNVSDPAMALSLGEMCAKVQKRNSSNAMKKDVQSLMKFVMKITLVLSFGRRLLLEMLQLSDVPVMPQD